MEGELSAVTAARMSADQQVRDHPILKPAGYALTALAEAVTGPIPLVGGALRLFEAWGLGRTFDGTPLTTGAKLIYTATALANFLPIPTALKLVTSFPPRILTTAYYMGEGLLSGISTPALTAQRRNMAFQYVPMPR